MVHNKKTNHEFGHQEIRDGETVSGSYHVLLPDNNVQRVTYSVGTNGYTADVKYEKKEPIILSSDFYTTEREVPNRFYENLNQSSSVNSQHSSHGHGRISSNRMKNVDGGSANVKSIQKLADIPSSINSPSTIADNAASEFSAITDIATRVAYISNLTQKTYGKSSNALELAISRMLAFFRNGSQPREDNYQETYYISYLTHKTYSDDFHPAEGHIQQLANYLNNHHV